VSLVAPSTDASTDPTEAEVPDPNSGGWVKAQTPYLMKGCVPNALPNTRGAGGGGWKRKKKGEKTPIHLLLPGKGTEAVEKLTSYWASHCLPYPTLTAERLNGLLMVASIVWSGRNKEKKTMRLPKDHSLRFIRSLGKSFNPATFVCRAWGCDILVKGASVNGKQTNLWAYPEWAEGKSQSFPVFLSPYQAKRWANRKAILLDGSNKANPVLAKLRETLALTKEGKGFSEVADGLTKVGEIDAVKNYRNRPGHANLTRDGEYGSSAGRLPEILRKELTIGGERVVELDVKSAHAVLMGMFYEGEPGEAWAAERVCFTAEAELGFPTVYGENKQHKYDFLSALNQRDDVGWHASEGYRKFAELFPLLTSKSVRIRCKNPKQLGSILRSKLAAILRDLVEANDRDGIRAIPVHDSAVVATPADHWKQHQAEFRTAWRLAMPIKTLAGASPLIEGSNGVSYQFFVSELPKLPAAPALTLSPTRTGTLGLPVGTTLPITETQTGGTGGARLILTAPLAALP